MREENTLLEKLPEKTRKRLAIILMAMGDVAYESNGVLLVDVGDLAARLGVTLNYFLYNHWLLLRRVFPSCVERVSTWVYKWLCGDPSRLGSTLYESSFN